MTESTTIHTSPILAQKKSKILSQIVRVLLAILAASWFLNIAELLGFLVLGIGGFLVSQLIQLSHIQYLQPLLSIILILIAVIAWKKIPAPKWVLICALYSLIARPLSLQTIPYALYLVEFFGIILSVLALHKANSAYNKEIGKITSLDRLLHFILFFAFIAASTAIGFWVQAMKIQTSVESARNIQNLINTPSHQLKPEQLAIKNSELDKDLNMRMHNLHFFVFEPYFRVTRATDGHRTYDGMCNSERALSILKLLKRDSSREPVVCKDSDTQAIVYATDNNETILCVDNNNVNPVVLNKTPTGLICKTLSQ